MTVIIMRLYSLGGAIYIRKKVGGRGEVGAGGLRPQVMSLVAREVIELHVSLFGSVHYHGGQFHCIQ